MQPRPRGRFRRTRNDEGLTLVEVIVAIMLLGLFAIIFAPVLYTNLDITARQTTIAYASQQASTYIDNIRASGVNTCSGLNSYTSGSSGRPSTVDGQSVTVKVSGAVTCPASTPGTATLTVTACVPAMGIPSSDPCAAVDRTLATISTQILVLS